VGVRDLAGPRTSGCGAARDGRGTVGDSTKGAATESLIDEGIHPFFGIKDKQGRTPKCFARGEWKVYLDPEHVPRAIPYVERNPLKEGKPAQQWSFVVAPRW
jgi:hypothetical protein